MTIYVYDAMGNLAAEYGSADAPPRKTCYSMEDMLASTRVVTDENGAPRECHHYLPSGPEVSSARDGHSGCYEKLKFTGKERDTETGLDYFGARYYASVPGRFTSADPVFFQAEMLADPQRFNLYAYGRNNPLRFVDPTGERVELIGSEDQRNQQLAVIRDAVGGGAAASRLSVVEENHRFYIDVGDIESFGKISDLAASFVPLLSRDTEVTQFEFVTKSQDLALIDPDTHQPRHLSDKHAVGVAGRDPKGQLHIYLEQPRYCCDPNDVAKFGPGAGYLGRIYWQESYLGLLLLGVPSDPGIEFGHEAGHAIYGMTHRGPNYNQTASDKAAVNLENQVRQGKYPPGPVRVRH